MDIFDLLNNIEDISVKNKLECPRIYIQLGDMQLPLMGISYYPEVKGVMDECIVLGDTENPKLIL